MSPKALTAFRIDIGVMEGLRKVKDRDGVPYSVQVDRALRAWLQQKGIKIKADSSAKRAERTAPVSKRQGSAR